MQVILCYQSKRGLKWHISLQSNLISKKTHLILWHTHYSILYYLLSCLIYTWSIFTWLEKKINFHSILSLLINSKLISNFENNSIHFMGHWVLYTYHSPALETNQLTDLPWDLGGWRDKREGKRLNKEVLISELWDLQICLFVYSIYI